MRGRTQQVNDFWLRLDNAAKIYPSIKDKELTSVFRVAVELKERVKARQFLEAVHAIENRFPYYKVTLKAGFFWYYLEPHQVPIVVESDMDLPCRAFYKNELMFRVLAKKNKISVEFSHILTDATGAFEFLKTLLVIYFEKCCLQFPGKTSVIDAKETPSKEEYEDAYNRYFKKIDSPPPKISRAFHVPFQLRNTPRFSILTAVVPVDVMLQRAKQNEVSLTEYLIAVYLFSLQNIYHQLPPFRRRASKKIIRIEVKGEKDRVKELEAEIKKLKIALADATMEKHTLETLIDIVNENYQTDVKKNLGQPQSKEVRNKRDTR